MCGRIAVYSSQNDAMPLFLVDFLFKGTLFILIPAQEMDFIS